MNIENCITRLETAAGFRRYALAFGLGALMVLTMAPIGLFPLLFIVVPAFATLSRAAPTRFKSFAVGWAFGAGYFIFGLYWVSWALFVDIAQFGWVLPLSAIVGPAALAIYYGFIPLLARPFRNSRAAHAFAVAAAWSLVEYARGHLMTGFPWIMPGYAWDWALPVMQTAAFTGVYGLTLLTLCWAAIPLLGRHETLRHVVLLSLLCAAAFGGMRMAAHETEQSGNRTIRVVQANIPQTNKWNKDDDWRNFEKHLDLSHAPATLKDPITFVVWPESSVQSDLAQFPEIGRLIGQKMPPGATGLLGAVRVEQQGAVYNFFNSLSVVDNKGNVLANYDKHHLVPFGEYIPFRNLLNLTPLALAVSGIGEFKRGPGPQTLHVKDLPGFSPLICYEAIFPHEVVDRNDRPDFLVNVTNDGWYGRTAGPHQHLSLTRMRAVEEGLPLARAANTGISAVFDPVGRVLGSQKLGTAGYIDTILPAPLPETVYGRFGDLVFFLLLACVTGLAIALKPDNCGV